MAYATIPKGKKTSHNIKHNFAGIGKVMGGMKRDAMKGYGKSLKKK
jgi:hypothetical protein